MWVVGQVLKNSHCTHCLLYCDGGQIKGCESEWPNPQSQDLTILGLKCLQNPFWNQSKLIWTENFPCLLGVYTWILLHWIICKKLLISNLWVTPIWFSALQILSSKSWVYTAALKWSKVNILYQINFRNSGAFIDGSSICDHDRSTGSFNCKATSASANLELVMKLSKQKWLANER